jgi:phospholipid-translocating ATPase
MAIVQFGGDTHSKPSKRQRWATQRASGDKGLNKRMSIMNRFHRGHPSPEEKRKSAGSGGLSSAPSDVGYTAPTSQQRKIYFNIPLPDDAKDEEGHPLIDYGRNKVRTAKYTPLSFVPKNLFLQFHNIANIYFFFIIILSVSIFPSAMSRF